MPGAAGWVQGAAHMANYGCCRATLPVKYSVKKCVAGLRLHNHWTVSPAANSNENASVSSAVPARAALSAAPDCVMTMRA